MMFMLCGLLFLRVERNARDHAPDARDSCKSDSAVQRPCLQVSVKTEPFVGNAFRDFCSADHAVSRTDPRRVLGRLQDFSPFRYNMVRRVFPFSAGAFQPVLFAVKPIDSVKGMHMLRLRRFGWLSAD